MAGFKLLYTTEKNGLVEIDGKQLKYWKDTGLPTFEGDIEQFEKICPYIIAEMVERGVLRKS